MDKMSAVQNWIHSSHAHDHLPWLIVVCAKNELRSSSFLKERENSIYKRAEYAGYW